MILRGREKGLDKIAENKFNQFLEILQKSTQVKIEKELKRDPRGFSMILTKQ
jgi:hypothetical protein